MTKLSEKEAWWVLGIAFYKPKSKRSKFEYKLTTWRGRDDGLCNAIDELLDKGRITMKTFLSMDSAIDDNLPCNNIWFCYTDRDGSILRADFCFLMYYSLEGE